MIHIVFGFLGAFFILKLTWNIFSAYSMGAKVFQLRGESTEGEVFHLSVEIFLWIGMVLCSFLIRGDRFLGAWDTFWIGLALIVFSYVYFFLVVMVFGIFASIKNRSER